MITFARHVVAPGEIEAVTAVLDGGSTEGDGAATKRASARLAGINASKRALLTTSCTHALELAALALGIGPDDEAVMPSYTFVSTANAFALRGARIRFADIDPHTFTMEAREIERALTPRTTVVCAMPYGGVTRDPDAIVSLCESRGIRLVVDAAHALFGEFRGRPLATYGLLSALSFHKTKNLSCGEGGAVVVNDPALHDTLEVLREKGTDRSQFLRGAVDKYTWRAVGSSYLPSDVLAAVLDAQLAHAPVTQARRHAVWNTYRTHLEPLAHELGLTLQHIPDGLAHPAHVFAVLVSADTDRRSVLRAMVSENVYAVSHYEPLHLAPIHPSREALPVTESLAPRLVRLPLHAGLTDDDVSRVLEHFVRAVRAARPA